MLPVHADVYDVQWDRYEQQDEPEEHGENVHYDECQMSHGVRLPLFSENKNPLKQTP